VGYVYQPKLKSGKPSAIWWAKWYVDGKPTRESTGSRTEKEALRFLKQREGSVALGVPLMPRADRTRYEEAAHDLRQYYVTTGSRDLKEAGTRLKHLDPFFAGRRLSTIGASVITDYIAMRQAEGAANGTINRELATLSRMLRLAYENRKLLRLPVIRKPKESGPRQGFFEREQYDAVRRRLSLDRQVAVAIAHELGWRTQSEVLTLEKRQIDLDEGTIRLDPGTTKNEDGRVVYLSTELKALVAAQLERVSALERRTGRVVPYLFPHLSGPHEGQRVQDFRKAWATACRKAGVAGRLRHDLRRTAVRDMVNMGVPERVAMTITGHKTRSVFDRYHIVSPADKQAVARKRDEMTASK